MEGIKALDNKFSKFNSCQELLNYIKAKKKHNFLEISKITNNRIDIILEKDNIEINLFKIKASPELIMKILFEEILNLKTNFKIFEINKEIIDEETNSINEKIESLIKENKNILKNIKNLEEENTKIKEENSKKKEDNIKIKEENMKIKEENMKIKEENMKIIEKYKELETNIQTFQK